MLSTDRLENYRINAAVKLAEMELAEQAKLLSGFVEWATAQQVIEAARLVIAAAERLEQARTVARSRELELELLERQQSEQPALALG